MSSVFIYQLFIYVDSAVGVCNFLELVLEELSFFSLCKFKGKVVLAWRNYFFADRKVFFSKFCHLRCNSSVIRILFRWGNRIVDFCHCDSL